MGSKPLIMNINPHCSIKNYHILTKHYINLSELTLLESKAVRVINTIQSNSFENIKSIY